MADPPSPINVLSDALLAAFPDFPRVGAYKIALHAYDVDPGDTFDAFPLEGTAPPPQLDDHWDVLEAALWHLERAGLAPEITGLTKDGDHKDCEAIFLFRGEPTVLAVR